MKTPTLKSHRSGERFGQDFAVTSAVERQVDQERLWKEDLDKSAGTSVPSDSDPPFVLRILYESVCAERRMLGSVVAS